MPQTSLPMNTGSGSAPSPGQIARTNMVESQIRPNRVHDGNLLQAMLNVPREGFVPPAVKAVAYADESLKIAPGRYLTEPLVTARLLENAAIKPGDRVLVVGAGTGYTSLLASFLAASVVALEDDETLRRFAAEALAGFGQANITLKSGVLTRGDPQGAPFEVIVVDGQVAAVPQAILDQLAEGGRLTTVLLDERSGPHGVVIERAGAYFSTRVSFDAAIPVLPGFEPKPGFEFAS